MSESKRIRISTEKWAIASADGRFLSKSFKLLSPQEMSLSDLMEFKSQRAARKKLKSLPEDFRKDLNYGKFVFDLLQFAMEAVSPFEDESLADQIDFAKIGQHILMTLKVQEGKWFQKMLTIAKFLSEYPDGTVVVLVRNLLVDRVQFIQRVPGFNQDRLQKGLPTLPQPVYLGKQFDIHGRLLGGGQIIVGLANDKNVNRVKEVLEEHPELGRKCLFILDEADQHFWDAKKTNSKHSLTEQALKAIFGKIHTFISVTATPLVLILGSTLSQIVMAKRPIGSARRPYFGIKQLMHIPVDPIDSKNYDPRKDPNLDGVMESFLRLSKPGVLLISPSESNTIQNNVASYIAERYSYRSDLVVMILNQNGITITADNETWTTSVTKPQRDGKYFTIGNAIGKFPNRPIVIIAGKLANRGQSFVDTNCIPERHLTDQYIVTSKNQHLVGITQMMRICGRYTDNPSLRIHCVDELWDQVKSCDYDLDRIIEKFQEVGSTPELIEMCMAYTRKLVPVRMWGNLDWLQTEGPKDGASLFEVADRNRKKFHENSLLWSSRGENETDHDIAAGLLNGVWRGGKATDDEQKRGIRRGVYCNPWSEIEAMRDEKGRPVERNGKIVKIHPCYDSIKALYEKHPDWIGRIILDASHKKKSGLVTILKKVS